MFPLHLIISKKTFNNNLIALYLNIVLQMLRNYKILVAYEVKVAEII